MNSIFKKMNKYEKIGKIQQHYKQKKQKIKHHKNIVVVEMLFVCFVFILYFV